MCDRHKHLAQLFYYVIIVYKSLDRCQKNRHCLLPVDPVKRRGTAGSFTDFITFIKPSSICKQSQKAIEGTVNISDIIYERSHLAVIQPRNLSQLQNIHVEKAS